MLICPRMNGVMLTVAASPGGPGLPPLRHRHRDPGGHLQGNQEALFRALLPGGRELHGGGLGDGEGQLQAEGNHGNADSRRQLWPPLHPALPHPQIFQGNHNPTDRALAFLPKQTLARYVRIRPLSWEQGICMRFEIYGCRTSGSVSVASRAPPFTLCFTHFLDLSPYRRGAR